MSRRTLIHRLLVWVVTLSLTACRTLSKTTARTDTETSTERTSTNTAASFFDWFKVVTDEGERFIQGRTDTSNVRVDTIVKWKTIVKNRAQKQSAVESSAHDQNVKETEVRTTREVEKSVVDIGTKFCIYAILLIILILLYKHYQKGEGEG